MMNGIISKQAVVKHETPHDSSVGIDNPRIRADINIRLSNEFNELILSPVVGIQKVRKVLHQYGLDIPALYELVPDGDEVVLEMDQYGKIRDYYSPVEWNAVSYYLYLLYVLNDQGYYDFHAELTDEAGIEEIMSEEDEDIDNV